MNKKSKLHDFIIIGAGMGGLTAASLLSRDGYSVLVLEASHVPGGCSSSYYRKGYIFESGATTLIGFDRNQPLRLLEEELGIKLPKELLRPSMTVHMNEQKIIRWQDGEEWIREAANLFGEEKSQESFWNKAFRVSEAVWKASSRNHYFPPRKASEYLRLLQNDLTDAWILPYAFRSVKEVAVNEGITNPDFYRFLDEQLIISAQSVSNDTPFLFGAPAATYTNYSNYYVPGGLIEMVDTLRKSIENSGGRLLTRRKAVNVDRQNDFYEVYASNGEKYRSRNIISNIPVWNMKEITAGKMQDYFNKESARYDWAWGAFTMGIATDDVYPDDMTLHHQVHVNPDEKTGLLDSGSVFVSFSNRGDTQRAPEGERVLNVSTHTIPEFWFNLNGDYDRLKESYQEEVLNLLRKKLPGFSNADLKLVFSATPVTWKNWIYRKKGRVGGIPQSMGRSLMDWTPAETPFEGLYLCGDTVFPGQGIPGVTLSGINVYLRAKNNLKNQKKSL